MEKNTNIKDLVDSMGSMMFFGKEPIGYPVATEKFGRNKWIDYGVNNLFPQEIIDLYHSASELHKALIDRKVDLIAGAGFDPIEALKEFLDNEFSDETLDEIAIQSALDLVLIGGYYLKIRWNSNGEIGAIEAMPIEKVRIEQPQYNLKEGENPDNVDIPGYWISTDWRKPKNENKPFWMCPFKPELYKEYPEQIFYVRKKSKGLDFYTEPDYSPILRYLQLEVEIATYHLKSVQNGFLPGVIIVNKQGIPGAKQREEAYNHLKERYGGAKNANDFIMVFAESAEKAPEFVILEPNVNDDKFRDLAQAIESKIMRAHKFTPAVAGIEVSGKLGSKDEVNEQLEMLQLTVIAPFQKIIEDNFNKLAKVNNLPQQMVLQEFKLFKEEEITPEEKSGLTDTVGGSQNVTSLVEKIKLGTLSREQVIAQLEIMYGFSPEQAIRLVGDAKEGEGLPAEAEAPATFLKTKENLN